MLELLSQLKRASTVWLCAGSLSPQLCSRSGVLVLTDCALVQPVAARSDFYAGLQSNSRPVPRAGHCWSLPSPVQHWELDWRVQTPPAIYLFPSVITALTSVNSYFHHNQTRPRTKNQKTTSESYWINPPLAELPSIWANDKNDKEDLILKANTII